MLLKTLLALAPMLLFSDAGGGAAGDAGNGDQGGAAAGGGNDADNDAGQGGDASSGGSDGKPQPTASINKQIKDFASQRGITVEALLSSYEELENAGKTELEKLSGERDRYKGDAERLANEIRDLRAESGFTKAANDAGALDAETLFMAYKSRLEFDKDGTATNVADVVNDLKKTKPSLFKPATGTSDAGRQGDSAGDGKADMNDFIRGLATDARAKR